MSPTCRALRIPPTATSVQFSNSTGGLWNDRERKVIPVTALIIGLVGVVADAEGGVIRQVGKRAGDWISQRVVDRAY